MMNIPKIGFGTLTNSDPQILESSLISALQNGYRYIDTAQVYQNEALIGKILQQIFAQNKIHRNELWITSKLWVTNRRPSLVEKSCRETLSKLGLTYLDLFLIHYPVSFIPQSDGNMFPKDEKGNWLIEHIDILDTWSEMEKLVEKKLVCHIGVSNFSIEMLERMQFSKKVKIQPFVNQIEFHVYNQQEQMIGFLEKHGILLTGYCPLLHGGKGPFDCSLFEDEVLKEISNEVGRTVAQVALKFLLQLSSIVNIIPKSVNPLRIRENIDLNFELNETQMQKIRSLNSCFRIDNGLEEWGYDVFSMGV